MTREEAIRILRYKATGERPVNRAKLKQALAATEPKETKSPAARAAATAPDFDA